MCDLNHIGVRQRRVTMTTQTETNFKTPFGYDRLQSSWDCVVGKKGSRLTSVRLRAPSTSGLAHKLFARSRFKISLEMGSRQTGFTLMELLVAMSLMVVASACLYSSLYTGFRAREQAEKVLIPLQAAKIAMDMIKQDLRGAVVGPDEDPNILAGPFLGEDDRTGSNVDTDVVTFFSSHHEINGDEERISCGVGLIEFSLVEPENKDTYTLVRNVTDNILTEDEQEPVEEVLCRNVRSLNFRYYDGLRWYEEWDSTEQLDALPMAVEVTLEMEPHEENPQTSSGKQTRSSRYDQDYLDSITRLTQMFVLPMALPMEAVEAAADAAEEAEEAAAAAGGGAGPGGGA